MKSRVLPRSRAFLRCASCRFAPLYFVPFVAGLVQAGRATPAYVLLGACFWIVHSLAIEVTNRLSDRSEDELNRPERTALCAYVGWDALRSIQLGLWACVIALDIVWIVLAGNPLFAALLVVSVWIGIGYSRGPRLSRVRYMGLVVFNCLFGGIFLMGWSVGDPSGRSIAWTLDQLQAFVPMLAVVGTFVVTLVGVKDITDTLGDLRIGYRSPFVELLRRRGVTALNVLVASPFALIGLFVWVGALSPRLLALLALAPMSAIVAHAAQRARTPRERLLVRELFYNHWLVFSCAALFLFRPDATLAVAIAGACVYWLLTTRWLHWGDALRAADLVRIARVAGFAGGAGSARLGTSDVN